MLLITSRTSFVGSASGGPSFSTGRGIIGGAAGGGSSLIGVGSRPWLQKVAALTVAVSLTIATADTFKVARQQYEIGYMDATALRDQVLGSLEIRVTHVISDVFLWLAQVQTLIRLFPRHKEKVLIKWIGFALIILDSTFSCLNSFMSDSTDRPRHFVDAIPALSYLFELALGLLYAAWVIYYSMTKRRYAYYHTKMKNICLIAFLSLAAVLTPVVFFVTDVSNSDIAGWGDYFRWVGAAAASVVVWEWVERIEALERDEKKDGILGREIFDGDEMLDLTPSEEFVWSGRGSRRDGGQGGTGNVTSALEHGLSGMAQRLVRTKNGQAQHVPHVPLGRAHSHATTLAANEQRSIVFGNLPKPGQPDGIDGPTPPPAIASPVSRTDNTSAASTVYVVHYDGVADVPQPVRRRPEPSGSGGVQRRANGSYRRHQSRQSEQSVARSAGDEAEESERPERGHPKWQKVANPFKRKRASPPPEVRMARDAARTPPSRATTPAHNFSRWDLKNRLGVFAADQGERFREKANGRKPEIDLPLTIIPAQPRGSGRTWSPKTISAGSSSGHTLTDGSTVVGEESNSPSGQSTGATRHQRRQPPRADDISPVAGNTNPTIIPAPRRSPHPLRVTMAADPDALAGGERTGTPGPSASFSPVNFGHGERRYNG